MEYVSEIFIKKAFTKIKISSLKKNIEFLRMRINSFKNTRYPDLSNMKNELNKLTKKLLDSQTRLKIA